MRSTEGQAQADHLAKDILKEWLERQEGNQKYEVPYKPKKLVRSKRLSSEEGEEGNVAL